MNRLIALGAIMVATTSLTLGAGPRDTKLEFQNSRVTVLRIRIAPHEKIPIHDVTPRAIVYLTDSHVKLIFPDGRVRNQDIKAGEVKWFSAQRHGGENVSSRAVEYIAIIPKP